MKNKILKQMHHQNIINLVDLIHGEKKLQIIIIFYFEYLNIYIFLIILFSLKNPFSIILLSSIPINSPYPSFLSFL